MDAPPSTRTYLVRVGVLHNFRAKVGGFDGAEVLLVALRVTGVLEEHVRCACFNLFTGVRV